jgi:hypothetical protein
MKIAIYGDSFGANPIGVKDYSLYPYIKNSWWEILSAKYNITNFCEWSASLLYSTEQFIQTHQEFDKVIFLITHPGRISVKHDLKYKHFVNYEYSTFWRKDAKLQGWNDLLDAVLSYYKFIQNDSLSNIQHQSYLSYIKSIRNDIFLIPCFSHSFKNEFSLCDIFDKEQQYWNVKYKVDKLDIRKGHLTNPNHVILADIFDRMLIDGIFNANIQMFKEPDLSEGKYIL